MNCAKCGALLGAGSGFCAACGTAVTPAASVVQLSAFGWFKHVLMKNYANFQGRARRREYWFFTLFVVLFAIGFAMIDWMIGSFDADSGVGVIEGLWVLGCLIPSLAVLVRRLHDTDRTGWWALLNLLPVVGPLVLLVFTLLDSRPGENRFGPNPKGR